MEKFYQTKECRAAHLFLMPSDWVDVNKPYYELHLKGGCYDSFQAGLQYSKDKPISSLGVIELERLVDMGWFTKDSTLAMSAKEAGNRFGVHL